MPLITASEFLPPADDRPPSPPRLVAPALRLRSPPDGVAGSRPAEQYRGTVQTAFQNVADTLNALEQDADALKTAAAAKDAAETTFNLTRQQWQTGYTNYQALLSAEQAYDQTMISLVQAQANRYADTAALFQALGGGWWNRPELSRN